MAQPVIQRKLANVQVKEFYHDLFVDTQVKHFELMCTPYVKVGAADRVVDVGGGCGFFAAAVTGLLGIPTRVIDLDDTSIEQCKKLGIEAIQSDALQPPVFGDESVVCFNLILHHLVGPTDKSTAQLQGTALEAWRNQPVHLFVNEYIYDSYISNLSGKLIYVITSSRVLSSIGNLVARIIPSLKANTFGVGVRFRATAEWLNFFESRGWRVTSHTRGEEEFVSKARRFLFIKSCRRDSFVLQAKEMAHS